MRKSLQPLLLAAAVLLPSAPALAGPEGVYVAPRLTSAMVKAHFRYNNNNIFNFSGYDYGSQEKWTYGAALAVGYDLRPSLKVPVHMELEYGQLDDVKHTRKQINFWGRGNTKSTLAVSTVFVNAYFDWYNRSAFTPYASLGLGISQLGAKATATEETTPWQVTFGQKKTRNTAWNIGLGTALRLSDVVSLDLGYRYSDLGKARTKAYYPHDYYVKTKKVETHQFLLGARFTF